MVESPAQFGRLRTLIHPGPLSGVHVTAIHTEADTLEELHREITGAVVCHFDPGQAPPLSRLHHVRQELLAL
jgi:hypothetical protein